MTGAVGARTQGLIVETALDLFSAGGYEATSMRGLAQRVGIKPASLYNYFPSKQMLLWQICTDAMNQLEQLWEHTLESGTRPVERLVYFLYHNTVFHANHRREAIVINHLWRTLDGEHLNAAAKFRENFYRNLLGVVEEGVGRGEFQIDDTRVVTLSLLDLAVGVATWYKPDGRLSPEELASSYVEIGLRVAGWPGRKKLPAAALRVLGR